MTKGQLVREPLLWFVLIGILLFWLDGLYNNASSTITINDAEVKRLTSLWQAQMQRPPSEAELDSLIDNWVNEETLYQEALRLRLDEADTIIRRRLLQKYNFLLAEIDESALTKAAVEAYYHANLSAYMQPLRVSYDHILLGSGDGVELEVRSELGDGTNWRTLGVSSLLASSYKEQSVKEIIFTMGPGFPRQLDYAQTNIWQGPIRSSFGRHLVRIISVEPPAPKPLVDIYAKVRFDLTKVLGEQQKADALKRLRLRYPVVDLRP